MTREEFRDRFHVEAAAMARLDAYAALLADWQERLNLVGPATLPNLWERHMADSAQLLGLGPAGAVWMDMGAGGGFPGIVLGAMGAGHVHLVESLAKKCAFLREAVAVTGAPATVHRARIEELEPLRPDVITARALAPAATLMGWGLRHARPDTLWVLPKGARHAEEVDAARQIFDFECELVPSITDAAARIVVARRVRPRRAGGRR